MIYDVEQLLLRHGINYEKNGNNIKCLCPNPQHNDKHIGSFVIDTNNGLGYCFSCHYSCNIIKLNRTLGEKVDRSKVDFKLFRPMKKIKKQLNDIKVCGNLISIFDNEDALNYVHEIGFNDDFLKLYGVKVSLYTEMISSKLFDNNPSTKIIDRIVIPLKYKGIIVSYECRSFKGGTPKVLYPKGAFNDFIFNYENLDLSKMVVLTESIKNLGKGWNVYKNIISSFGNKLSDEKMKILNTIPKLTLFMDYDNGGFTMLNELADKYKGELYVTYCSKQYRDNEGKLKGYDMNDLSLSDIRKYIINAKPINEVMNKIKTKKIFW